MPAILIFLAVYLVLALGRLPDFRVDRTGACIIGASLMIGFGVLDFEHAAINYDTIITGPALKPTVDRIISNTVKPGATNNEKNLWNGVLTKHVICPWLINKVQAGAADYWFLQDSNTHTLKGFVGEYPTVLPEAKIDPMVMNVVAVTSGVYGWFDWRGMYGSDGGS